MAHMRKIKRLLLAAGFVLAAIDLSVHAQQARHRAEAVWQHETICLETPLSDGEAHALLEKDSETAFSVWGERTAITVKDPDLGRTTQADVLTVCGPCEPILPLSAGLSDDDTDGCLIGEQTAWELFGSTQVVGDTIAIGDEIRTVRALLHFPQSIVVMHESPGSSAGRYNRITLPGGQETDGQAFLMQHGLAGSALRFDCLKSARWLAELIPGKWSDFSGWKKNLRQKREEFTLLFRVQKNCVELCCESQCLLYLWNTMLAAVCVFASAAVMAGIIKFDKCGNTIYNIFTTFVRNRAHLHAHTQKGTQNEPSTTDLGG